jgi:hypothetical protein
MKDGEVYFPCLDNHKMECCDCGLVHRVTWAILTADGQEIPDAVLAMAAWRDKKLTKAARKRKESEAGEV